MAGQVVSICAGDVPFVSPADDLGMEFSVGPERRICWPLAHRFGWGHYASAVTRLSSFGAVKDRRSTLLSAP